MDIINFNQSGGFPLTTNILNAMQNAYGIFNALGNLAGNFTIISGCVETGSSVSDGVVFINGEVLPFKGGTKISKVRIIENTENKEFEDGSTQAVIFKRFVEFGTGTNAIDWSKFKKPDPLLVIMQNIASLETRLTNTVPIGLVAVWDRPADEIPNGWVEHQDLRGRAPVGQLTTDTDFKTLGKNFGEKKHQLTIDEMPKHRHNMPNDTSKTPEEVDTSLHEYGGHTIRKQTLYTSYEGGSKAHNNMQPSRIVRFIRFVGFN